MAIREEAMLAVMLAASACGTVAPDRSLRSGELERGVSIEEVPVKGFTVRILRVPEGAPPEQRPETVEGELLAEDEQAVWLQNGSQRLRIPRNDLVRVEISLYPSNPAGVGVWTGFGAASTLTHGWYFPLSAALWLVMGIPSAFSESAQSQVVLVPPIPVGVLRQYARFPQGMPEAPGGPPPPEPAPPKAPGPGEPAPTQL